MKKIITILFFAGFLTTASFAQSGRRQQNNNQSNLYGYQPHQSSVNIGDQYSQNSRNDYGGYRDNQWNGRNNENDYRLNNGRGNRNRSMREDRHDYQSHNHRRFEDHYNRNDDRSW